MDIPNTDDFVRPIGVIPDHILAHLSRKLHILSTREHFDIIVQDWDPELHSQHGSAWYTYEVALITQIDIEHQERRQVVELEGAGDLEEDGESEFYIKETTC